MGCSYIVHHNFQEKSGHCYHPSTDMTSRNAHRAHSVDAPSVVTQRCRARGHLTVQTYSSGPGTENMWGGEEKQGLKIKLQKKVYGIRNQSMEKFSKSHKLHMKKVDRSYPKFT